MKKFLYLLLATAMLATFGCTGDTNTNSVGSPNPNPFQPKGTVSGVLLDACTNEPIANADVYILDKKATTNAVGMFTIKKVPANTAVGNETDNTLFSLPLGSGTALLSNKLNSWDTYNVVIDLTKVNAARAKVLGATLYPSIAYHTVKVSYTSLGETSDGTTTATNHDTPVDGFVANIKPQVGKLSATLNVETVNGNNGAVLAGASVQLISLSPVDGFSTENNVTGDLVNTIATNTTGADGRTGFEDVEAKHIFYAKATWTNPVNGHVWTGHSVVWTECDGTTTNFYTVGPNPPIQMFDEQEDDIEPYIQSVTPANLADIAQNDAQTVVFTFSEVLQPTQYILNTTVESSAAGGIYKDIKVNYDGPKAGNMAYTLAWDSTTAPKVLTVTFATAVSSKYTVDMTDVIANAGVKDTNGNLASNAPAGLKNTFIKTTFTTGGGLAVTSPTITRFGAGNETRIDWLPMANAFTYHVYIARIIDGVTSSYLYADATPLTTYDIQNSALFAAGGAYEGTNTPGSNVPFNNGETKITYSVYVVTVNSDGTESTPVSNAVVINDLTRPTATGAWVTATPIGTAIAAGATSPVYTCDITFSEVMDKVVLQTLGSWTAALTPAATFSFTPTLVTVSYTGTPAKSVARLSFTLTNTTAAAATPLTIGIATIATDLNGNLTNPALIPAF
jgi:hypothetical protein